MNLHLAREGEPLPANAAEKRGDTALAVPATGPLPKRGGALAVFARVNAFAAEDGGACHDAQGEATREADEPVACPNNVAAEEPLDERARQAARLEADGVLLDRPDAWYAAGPRGAGFCAACQSRLNLHLASVYGEQFVPYDALAPHRTADAAKAPPFWRELEALRLRAGVEHGARLARRVRDEARKARTAETTVGASLAGASPAAVLLATKLDFVVVPAPAPVPERSRVSSYEVLKAALGRRPLVAQLDPETSQNPALVTQAARLASAALTEVALDAGAPDASHEALAAHRRFWKEFRSRYRPDAPLGEVLLLYSAQCDHLTRGRHGSGVRAAAEALTALGAQYRVVLSTPRLGTEPLVLVDASALPAAEAARIERRVTEGSSAITVGLCRAADDDGRELEGPLPELAEGLNRVGAGTVFCIDRAGAAAGEAERRYEPLSGAFDKALESLLGRGRRAASVSRRSLVVKMYLDPEKKLDVHLVGRAFDARSGAPERVEGAVLHLAGAAVSGARTGYLFTMDGQDRKLSLTPFGMGVQALLPPFEGAAVLTIAR